MNVGFVKNWFESYAVDKPTDIITHASLSREINLAPILYKNPTFQQNRKKENDKHNFWGPFQKRDSNGGKISSPGREFIN